jgi:hypothetical protein
LGETLVIARSEATKQSRATLKSLRITPWRLRPEKHTICIRKTSPRQSACHRTENTQLRVGRHFVTVLRCCAAQRRDPRVRC